MGTTYEAKGLNGCWENRRIKRTLPPPNRLFLLSSCTVIHRPCEEIKSQKYEVGKMFFKLVAATEICSTEAAEAQSETWRWYPASFPLCFQRQKAKGWSSVSKKKNRFISHCYAKWHTIRTYAAMVSVPSRWHPDCLSSVTGKESSTSFKRAVSNSIYPFPAM